VFAAIYYAERRCATADAVINQVQRVTSAQEMHGDVGPTPSKKMIPDAFTQRRVPA
jgi:hypothetical protein